MEENKKPQNPFAFASHTDGVIQEGMTLRDYFANSAMQGILSCLQNSDIIDVVIQSITKDSYQIADAMLKQREKL